MKGDRYGIALRASLAAGAAALFLGTAAPSPAAVGAVPPPPPPPASHSQAPAAGGGPSPSSPVRILTLGEALEAAVAANRDLLSAREFRRSAEGRYVEERSAALPKVTAQGTLVRSLDDSTPILLGGGLRSTRRAAELSLSQPLFTWWQVSAAIRAGKEGIALAGDRARAARGQVARDVTAAFHDVLLAKELHAIAVKNLEQKERHRAEAAKRFDAGVATDYDVLAARVGAENARPEVIRTANGMREARERLRYLLGGGDREVDAAGSLDVPAVAPPDREAAVAEALSRRPEIAEAAKRKAIAREQVRIAAAGDKPRLDFRGSLGYGAVEFGNMDGRGQSWSLGLFASWPLFDGLRSRGLAAQSESEVRSLAVEEGRLADAVALEARTAADRLREAGEIAFALSGTVEEAEKLLSMAEKGFEFGVKTRLEVEDAELAVVTARGNLARAKRDWLVARAEFDRARGVLDGNIPPEPAGDHFVPASGGGGIALEVLKGDPDLGRQ
jgi:HAE1 family hydrophobic/amphiphilic exporter-1